MSNIADGIEYALQQSRAEREKVAEINTDPGTPAPLATGEMGLAIKEAAKVLLASDGEDVTVGDLEALMGEFQ